jgi:hypothetical protein
MSTKTPLEIKFGVVKRGVKELEMYHDEVHKGEEALKTSGEDGIKQAKLALEESHAMVVNTHDRLQVAIKELSSLLDTEENHPPTNPLISEAREWLEKAKKLVGSTST